METNHNGLIINGRVYVADPKHVNCNDNCALKDFCDKFGERCGIELCLAFGATEADDFGYRFSQKLTDKLKENYETPNI